MYINKDVTCVMIGDQNTFSVHPDGPNGNKTICLHCEVNLKLFMICQVIYVTVCKLK